MGGQHNASEMMRSNGGGARSLVPNASECVATPFSPSDYREGEPDPLDPKVIVTEIVALATDFIIYLDQQHRITTQISPPLSTPAVSRILVRAEVLQSLPIEHCKDAHIRASRVLIAQAVQAILCGESETAAATLDEAEQFIAARSAEVARRWYIEASTVAIIVISIVAFVLSRTETLAAPFREFCGFAAFGAVGAYLSMLQRLAGFPWDPCAGRLLHTYESVARLLIGSIGALVVAIGVKAGVFLSFSTEHSDSRYWLIVLACLVAGISERLIPNFVQRVETQIDGGDRTHLEAR